LFLVLYFGRIQEWLFVLLQEFSIMKQHLLKKSLGLFVIALILTACNVPFGIGAGETPSPAPVTPTDPAETPSLPGVSELEPKYLTICLGQEPNTLYPYGRPNPAARSVLAAIYDGPVDVFLDGYQPVILEAIPSLSNGDAEIVPVKATRGDLIVNTSDEVVLLDAGAEYYPAGCNDPACAQRYSGTGEVELDQMVVTFRIKPDILWSDGQPLTAQDTIFAHRIDSDAATSGSKYLVDRTQTYETVDELTVQWWGRPGYLDPTYADNFWSPLPFHAWGGFSAADLAQAEAESRPPLGWGAYTFENWTRGESIRLRKNPNYFRAEEGLPAFEILTFRFVTDRESGLAALVSGECDLLDSSLRLESQVELLFEMEGRQALKVAVSETPIIERLDFGIRPAAYDDGIGLTDRPNLFGDVRTRQAIAFCLDRQRVADEVLSGLTYAPAAFIFPAHPAYSSAVANYPFDPNQGIALLEQAGWLDHDRDPSTPRISSGAVGVPDGVPLLLTYQTGEAIQRRQTADILLGSLRECGIGVEIRHISTSAFYAPGPDGPLFGRQFDLAVYAVGFSGPEPACYAYTEAETPNAGNNWVGLNVMGYRNSDFDALCQKARRVLPDQPQYNATYQQLQSIFANDLPSIPLYARLKLAVSRIDLCNFNLTPNVLFELWNLEEFDIGPACRPT
jgi:peptide/nickel transport system substrate-binding protein